MQVTDEMIEKAKAELFKSGMVDVFSVRAALTAALSVQERAVEVKKLEWVDDEFPAAECVFGHYAIHPYYKTVELVVGYGKWSTTSLGRIQLDAAASTGDLKAAAQSDYEQRIRSALVDVPVEPVAWQWRTRIKGGAWDAWENGRYGQPVPPFMDVEERPLYASSLAPHREGEDSAKAEAITSLESGQ